MNPSDAAALSAHRPTHARGPSEESERRLRAAVQNSSDIVMIFEADATIRYASPAVERVLGYTPEDLVGTRAFDYVHPEDLEYMSKSFAETLKKPGFQTPVEYRVRTADGSWRYMEAIRSNRLDDPDVAGLVANVRDVTERKESEERIRFQLRLLDAVGQAVIAVDLDGNVLYWNGAAQELYGWSSEEVMGRRLREFVVWEGSWERAEEIMSALRVGRSWSGEFVLRRKDGTTFPAMVTDTPIHDELGNLIGIIGVSTDITERVQTEEALKESEERFRLMAENAQDLVYRYRFKPEPGFEYVSPSATAITGYTPEEHYADPELGLKIVHPDDRHLLDEALRSPESPTTVRWRRKDGELVWTEQRNKPIYDEVRQHTGNGS
jgi:PAS domain S-box-containing protein